MLRLSATGRAALAEIRGGYVGSPAGGQLARRLTDAGLAHPRPSAVTAADVTVVVPVRDRVDALEMCLASLGDARCVVVDDGSSDPDAIAAVARRHCALLLRRETSGGPAVARNAAVEGISTELVAFIDSDCIAPLGWIDGLAGHFEDPLVGAVAPRVVPAGPGGRPRYLDRIGLHDLGKRASRVQPLGRIAFVPTAALVVRRSALDAVGVFEPTLRYGEDVDLVWRLDAAAWRVRYDPAVEVAHEEPSGWSGRLARRYHYGTAAAPLAKRHPRRSAHLVVSPWPVVGVAGLLAGRPVAGLLGAAGTAATTRRALRRADLGELSTAKYAATALTGTWRGVGRYTTQFGLPLVAAAAWRSKRPATVAALAALVVAPSVADWLESRPAVSLGRYVGGRIADDAAYGAGVYAGCLDQRTAAPLRVVVQRQAGERNVR
jgi:mycofactocin system glycosyltransferase